MPKENYKPSGYNYSRVWFDFALYNPGTVTGNHTALYLWLVELNNRLKWLDSFGLTYREGMDGMSCKSRTTYNKCFKNLIEWGFIKIVKKSRNQYEANIIAISKNVQAKIIWQTKICTTNGTTNGISNGISNGTIHLNSKNNINSKKIQKSGEPKIKIFVSPALIEVEDYFLLKGLKIEYAAHVFEYYETANWHDSNGNKIKNWKQKILAVWMKPGDQEKFENKLNNKDHGEKNGSGIATTVATATEWWNEKYGEFDPNRGTNG